MLCSQSLSTLGPRTDLKMKPTFLELCILKMYKSKTSQKSPSLYTEAIEKEAHLPPRTLRDSTVPF